MKITTLEVTEDIQEDGSQTWGISFNGSNPDKDDCVQLATKEDAFKLQSILSPHFPPVLYTDMKIEMNDEFQERFIEVMAKVRHKGNKVIDVSYCDEDITHLIEHSEISRIEFELTKPI